VGHENHGPLKRMSSHQVRSILILYRPGTADGEDPEMAEALAAVAHHLELARWFAQHCALYEARRDKFRQIPVPRVRSVLRPL
jgi:hypothetical protein